VFVENLRIASVNNMEYFSENLKFIKFESITCTVQFHAHSIKTSSGTG
jgi:hypothetical protein